MNPEEKQRALRHRIYEWLEEQGLKLEGGNRQYFSGLIQDYIRLRARLFVAGALFFTPLPEEEIKYLFTCKKCGDQRHGKGTDFKRDIKKESKNRIERTTPQTNFIIDDTDWEKNLIEE